MKKAVILLATAIAATFSTHPATAQQDVFGMVSEGNSILSVNGSGKITKEPDIAVFQVAVVSTGQTAAEALQTNSLTMRRVFDTIDRFGIPSRDVQTNEVGIRPIFARRDNVSIDVEEMPRITGYRAANSIRITYRKLDEFGSVIDDLVSAGANQVDGPSFSLADTFDELDAARIAAVQDARRKADLYAGAAGMKVARILFLADNASRYRDEPANVFGFFEAREAAPISPGEISVSASVNVMFELEPL
ncbi:MAG: SIMPL domain-containing protein [Pseudomonadota bacterium]